MAIRKHGTTTNTTVSNVALALPHSGWRKIDVEVINRGSTELFVRGDGVDPTSTGADDDYIILPGGAEIIPVNEIDMDDNEAHVRIVSSATCKYSAHALLGGRIGG